MRNGLDYSEHYKAEETLQGEAEGAFSCICFVRGKYMFTNSPLSCSAFVGGKYLLTQGFVLAHYSLQECLCGGQNWQPAKRERSKGFEVQLMELHILEIYNIIFFFTK